MPIPARASCGDRLGAAVGVRALHLQRRRVGFEVDEPESRRGRLGLRALLRVEQRGPAARRCPTDAFSWPGVPSAITLPWSITAIPSASWSASSRYCVQSRIVVPAAGERADDVPHLVARARVEARGRLVEEHQLAA